MLKDKLWLFQIPLVALFTGAYLVTEHGIQGDLKDKFLAQTAYPNLQRVMTLFSDAKFRMRGPTPPKNKIVVLAIDNAAVDMVGRWPWHRDVMAEVIERTFEAGAKVVGLDIVFSEPDTRVSPELRDYFTQNGKASDVERFESDHVLTSTIQRHRDKLVLGAAVPGQCRPIRAFKSRVGDQVNFDTDECPVMLNGIEVSTNFHAGYDKFALPFQFPASFDPWLTPVITGLDILSNLDEYNAVAAHTGYFDAFPDSDHVIRRGQLVMFYRDKVYPSLPLEMARIGLNEEFEIDLDKRHGLDHIRLKKSGRELAVTDMGSMPVNFRGPAETFPYVSVAELFPQPAQQPPLAEGQAPGEAAEPQGGAAQSQVVAAQPSAPQPDTASRAPASAPAGAQAERPDSAKAQATPAAGAAQPAAAQAPAPSRKDLLKDAYVLIGVTALGLFDMRAFPFDPNVAGVEGHANILDNILTGDMIRTNIGEHSYWILFLMIVGAFAFAYGVQRLESVPALLLAVFVFGGLGVVDVKVMFNRNIDLNTSFLYLELMTIFFVIFVAKYIIEERSKKFVRGAFAKYVAPAVVDSILKNPEKLQVGGEKKDLTIMFSDIRSFTTFSEKMDAKALATFLNDYLGIMTKIVFANQGTLDKYIGDAIMAFWGAPLDQPLHAGNACSAAIAMMKALHENKDRWLKDFNVDVNIGVGINSGPVNVGNMGSTDNFAYTVIGDHVNLSSRLEGLTKAYGVSILTTRFTFDEIIKAGEKLPPHRILDNVKVKGKKKAVELIQVLDRTFSQDGLETFEAARKLYLSQQWDLAVEKFREANAKLAVNAETPDGPSEIFIERCQEFKLNPPAQDWDGEWEMHSK